MITEINPEQLVAAVNKCILLKPEEKEYWVNNANNLPQSMVAAVYNEVATKNQIIDKYLIAAIQAAPEKSYVEEVKNLVNNAKMKAIEIEENTSSGNVEDYLEKQIQNI